MKRSSLIAFLALALFVFGPRAIFDAHAEGFGITPPYVDNNSLTQNSHYEQTIILVRSDPAQDLEAKVTVNVPGADSWITIDKGTEFALPAGVQQMPMIVSVDVPSDAKLGHYAGNIQIVVSPLNAPTPGTVGITIGAQIDVNLQVIDQKMANFTVRRVTLANAEVGHSFWWMNFPAKVLFTMDIANSGNIAASPDKVTFQFEEYLTQKVLETETNTNHLASIEPFQSKSVVAEMPAYLPQGSYKVFYEIYGRDDGDIIGQGTLDLSILPPGTLTGYIGYGFWGLRLSEKLITFGVIAALILALYGIVFCARWLLSGKRKWRWGRRNGVLVTPPPPPPDY